MTNFYLSKNSVVQSVNGILDNLKPDSQLIMTITRGTSEGFCVSHVIDLSSDDTDLQTAKFFSETQVNT